MAASAAATDALMCTSGVSCATTELGTAIQPRTAAMPAAMAAPVTFDVVFTIDQAQNTGTFIVRPTEVILSNWNSGV